jgi:formate hydrogenlyase subunit 3/multisubunit Na+/H+ antiporter MnhD subunit
MKPVRIYSFIVLATLLAGCGFASKSTIIDGVKNYTVIVDLTKILISLGIVGSLFKVILRIKARFRKRFFGKNVEKFSFNDMYGGILYK